MAFAYRAVFLLLLSSLALSHASSNGDTVTERILQGFKDVRNLCDSLRIDSTNINAANAPEQGSIIALGVESIIEKLGHGIEKMSTASPLPDVDARLIVASLTKFVQAHEALLSVVTAKNGVFTLEPSLFASIKVSLANLEMDLDIFASKLIDLIPTQRPAAEEQFHSLAITLKQGREAYGAESTQDVTQKTLQGIQTVTDMSNNLRAATETINGFNAAQKGIIIAQGFTTIIAKISEGITRVSSVTSGPLPDADAVLIVKALTTFVQVHQALLNVVIGKHGILALFPFFEPIRLSLVSLETVIDTLAFDLISLIPTQKPAAEKQFALLSVTLQKAQDTYSYVSRPTLEESTADVMQKTLQGIKTVTDMSNNLRAATETINGFNAAQKGVIIAQGFTTIIAKIGEGITRVSSVTSGPLPDADAVLIVEALTTFVQNHQALLNVVIGKHGILALFPFFEPIRLALVSLEAVIDTLAFDLIALIPTQQPAAEHQFALLSVTLHEAQNTYTYGQTTSIQSTDDVTQKTLQGIKTVTDMSNNLRAATKTINGLNAAQKGVIIAQGFTTIITKIGEGITRVSSVTSGPLPDADAVLIVEALTTFVQIHQALLNVVIGKHGILALFPFFEPIRLSLVSLEAVIDTLAFDLIALIPTQQPAAEHQFALLSVTLHKAQNTYSYGQSNLASVVAKY